MTDLKSHLDQIRKSMPKLNKVSDDAARLVRLVEKTLRDMGVGFEARVVFAIKASPTKVEQIDYDTERETKVEEYECLVYERISGEFRIGIAKERWTLDHEDRMDEMLHREILDWSSADRGKKLASFEKLPSLVEQIAEEVVETASRLEKTTATVETVLKAFDSNNEAQPGTQTVKGKGRPAIMPHITSEQLKVLQNIKPLEA